MANFVCFLAARAAKARLGRAQGRAVARRGGACWSTRRRETHTWIQKAADLFGLGTDAIRWIADRRSSSGWIASALRRQIEQDLRLGHQPFLVVGTAGSVSTGAVDPLPEIARHLPRTRIVVSRRRRLRRAGGAGRPGSPASLRALSEADSVAVDPHKWLYAPLEAGCALVRDAAEAAQRVLVSPGLLPLRRSGRELLRLRPAEFARLPGAEGVAGAPAGRARRISEDDRRRHPARAASPSSCWRAHPEFEAMTQSLSITTFRYVPPDLRPQLGSTRSSSYLNELNQNLLTAVEKSGEAFLSNALIGGRFAAAGLHRELPHLARRHRGAARAAVAAGKRGRRPSQTSSSLRRHRCGSSRREEREQPLDLVRVGAAAVL